jgi:hypothetical protein
MWGVNFGDVSAIPIAEVLPTLTQCDGDCALLAEDDRNRSHNVAG